ncbi:MAG: hybrid sensor histidine kinase/response regulator [Calditrichaeota bacterium]|nr:MAG: hybrid sensor histidine kinase/response regulator [Calditrichota bacterium]
MIGNMESTKALTGKILIVEDSKESVDLLAYFLKPAGYELVTVSDGIEAIQYISQELPDLILLDVVLPRMNGFQVCERLKKDERTFHIPIIMITNLKELKDKIRGLEAGADDFITKPFDSVELLTRVRSLLRMKYYYDELRRRNQLLEEQKRRLEREDLLKKHLTNLIVNDMKNPLSQIQGNLQLLDRSYNGEEVDKDVLIRRIARSTRDLLRMVLNLLDISRLEQATMELNPTSVNVPGVIEEVLTYYRDTIGLSGKNIHLQLSNNLPAIHASRELFERVMDNLFNFVFYNRSPEGRITILADTPDNRYMRLKIRYDGKVIPRRFHDKLFSKAAQAELRQAGFNPAKGLGLIFCKLAVEAQGGTIGLDPTEENGTCFELRMPIYSGEHTATNSDSAA